MQLREEAALQPDGSRAKRLLTWAEIHFGDTFERILELEEEATQMDIERENLRIAILKMREMHQAMADYAQGCARSLNGEIFSRDFSGWINLMAGHGDPDYLKSNGQSVSHVDLRSKPPRKKKEAK